MRKTFFFLGIRARKKQILSWCFTVHYLTADGCYRIRIDNWPPIIYACLFYCNQQCSIGFQLWALRMWRTTRSNTYANNCSNWKPEDTTEANKSEHFQNENEPNASIAQFYSFIYNVMLINATLWILKPHRLAHLNKTPEVHSQTMITRAMGPLKFNLTPNEILIEFDEFLTKRRRKTFFFSLFPSAFFLQNFFLLDSPGKNNKCKSHTKINLSTKKKTTTS